MKYEDLATRQRLREGKTSEELMEIFKDKHYRTERSGSLEDGCFVDLLITTKCNFNCSGCDHFAPIADSYYVDINTFKDQLVRLKKLLPQLNTLTFWGGEALLHPKAAELTDIAREVFPNIDIVFGSNGVLVETLSDETLDIFAKNKVGFEFSRYLIDGNTVYTGIDRLEERNISYSFTEYRLFFQAMGVDPLGQQDPTQWYTCSRCNMPTFTYKDYKLYKCGFGACSSGMKTKGINIPEIEWEDYLDLKNDNLKPEDIFTFVFKPSNKCKYCKEAYLNTGFVHQLEDKKGAYLFDMKDLFHFNYKEYKKYNNSDLNMFFMKEHFNEEWAWDVSFNPMLEENIKNRYYFGEQDIIIELNSYDNFDEFKIQVRNIIKYAEKNNNKKDIYYIIFNDLSLEEEEYAYKEIKSQCFNNLNSYFFKKDINETLRDVYNFIINNSYSDKITFLYFENQKNISSSYKRTEVKKINFMNVSKDLLKYFNYNERDIFSNIEEIFFNYLIILKEKDVKLFKKYINTFTINNELLFAFKLILTFNLYDVFKKENLLFESEQELFSDFFNEKGNLFIDFLNHVTYDKDSLELKVISILNKSKDIRVLNVMDEYLESQNKEDYFDKLLLS